MTQSQESFETNSAETATEGSDSSSTIPNPSITPLSISDDGQQQPKVKVPPPGYENVAGELWPGPDGKPPELTEALLRKLRGKYFTVRHPRLTECGHLLDMINQPRNNCETCWWTFFNTHAQLVEVADQFFRTHGKNAMVSMRGTKFFRNFLRFMSTVNHFIEEDKKKQCQTLNPTISSDESSIGLPSSGLIERTKIRGVEAEDVGGIVPVNAEPS